MSKIRNTPIKKRLSIIAAFLLALAIAPQLAQGQQPVPPERIAEFKQSLQKSQAQLRQYEWIETTTVSLKGEVKSQKQNRVYYGADGKLQKVAVGDSPAPQEPQGRRGGRLKAKIVANKKEEMTDYMQRAVSLIHKYVPPEPGMIQFAKDNGKASFDVFEPNKVIRLSFKDIINIGDLMTATLDIRSNAILDINVSTYLESQQDAVILGVNFARLPDGTSYAGQTTLDAKAKNIKVVVENSGHRALN
ncbi:MAG: hypothetical protein H7070_00325 [Saprospiraceae bacterium]|nr:hypothetical protein [Pyrinomonadaceae bacterium]